MEHGIRTWEVVLVIITWDWDSAPFIGSFSDFIVEGSRIQENILELAPFMPGGGLSKLLLWASNPTESLFHFPENSARQREDSGWKHSRYT